MDVYPVEEPLYLDILVSEIGSAHNLAVFNKVVQPSEIRFSDLCLQIGNFCGLSLYFYGYLDWL